MERNPKLETRAPGGSKGLSPASKALEGLLTELSVLPGGRILDRIVELDHPGRFVRGLAPEDFFWLVKKVGAEDCIPVLELASVKQWQYLLDLEIWTGDKIDLERTSEWLKRLQAADTRRVAQWFLGEGEPLGAYYFCEKIQVAVVDADEDIYSLPEGFFTLDGVLHFRVLDPAYRDTVEAVLRAMADEDFALYRNFVLGLAKVLPAESEEEMYRLRNVRLAEHGFLPFEEAVAVYAPLSPETLRRERPASLERILAEEDVRAMVPLMPIARTDAENILTAAIAGTQDPLLLDRLRLEFAGLCNQLIAADRETVDDQEVMIRVCRRAGRYLNLALDRLGGRDGSSAEEILRSHPLLSLFRVGFGLTLRLRWDAEHWLEESWFGAQGLSPEFWGEEWGGCLAGLLRPKPRFFAGSQAAEEYRDFEWVADMAACAEVLGRLKVLDRLLREIVRAHSPGDEFLGIPDLTFRPLLFNLWARHNSKLPPGFSGVTPEQARALFGRLRGKKAKPPYRMPGAGEDFVKTLMAYIPDMAPEASALLKETLEGIWEAFKEEHARLSTRDMDARYLRFITIDR